LLLNVEEQWREGNDLHVDSVDVYLLECLEADFNIDFENDTIVTEVSRSILHLYTYCVLDDLNSAKAMVDAFAKRPDVIAGGIRPAKGADEDDDDDDDDDEGNDGQGNSAGSIGALESSKDTPGNRRRVVDEEGWETIVPKGGKNSQKGKASVPGAPPVADASSSSDIVMEE
jgi:hypothetical protein